MINSTQLRPVDKSWLAGKSKRTLSLLRQTWIPGKPVSANRGLNLANRGIHFFPRLDSVPERIVNLNLGIH